MPESLVVLVELLGRRHFNVVIAFLEDIYEQDGMKEMLIANVIVII